MSSQKDKYLASAQKYIQKGQFDRALRDYEQVVTADPKDVKHRQKLAELLVRCNRREEAIREYDTIARYYEENGFNLKSIAVYKQIQRLDPSNIEISLSLAALNEKQGMIGNALSEYKTVFDAYEKSGRMEDALKILEKMQGVDPDNTDIRLKLAEALYASGARDRAHQEYMRAALALKERGMTALFDKVCGKIRELFPEKADSGLEILAEQIRSGVADDALPKLRQLLQDEPDNLRVLSLLADAYRVSGDVSGRREALRRILEISSDDLAAVKGLIECSVEEGDVDGSLALIDRYLSALVAGGAYGELERYYTALQNSAPYDIRLLEGLQSLYERTGESAKLADVQVTLNILSRKEGGGSAAPPEEGEREELSLEETSSAGPEASVGSPWGDEIDLSGAVDVGGSSQPESEWGDEIDLTAAVDVVLERQEGSTESDIMDFAAVDLTPPSAGEQETESEEFEIDISFELPEDADLFAAPGPNAGREVSSGGAEHDAPDFMSLAGAGMPMADAGGETEFVLDMERGSQLPFPVEERFGDESPGGASFSPDSEPQADASLSFQEPVLEISSPDRSDLSPFPEEGFSPPVGVAEGMAREIREQEDTLHGFKEVLDQQLEHEDVETYYNLGIAYMEMGLYDDAIKQFRIAANEPSRELDCLTLLGVCLREKGDYPGAEQVLSALLSRANLESERVLNLRYELGLLYMATSRGEEALQSFREVFSVNPGFRETMSMIAKLSGKAGSLDLPDMEDVDIELEEIG